MQDKGRLAYARLATDKHQRPAHETAAQHPVEFAVSQVDARLLGHLYVVDALRAHPILTREAVSATRRGGRLRAHHLLDVGIPFATHGTTAYPFGRLGPAIIAIVNRFCLCHILRNDLPPAKLGTGNGCRHGDVERFGGRLSSRIAGDIETAPDVGLELGRYAVALVAHDDDTPGSQG